MQAYRTRAGRRRPAFFVGWRSPCPCRGDTERLPPLEFWEELRADLRAVATALNALSERFGRVEQRVSSIEESDKQKATTNRWLIGLLVMAVLGLLGMGATVLGVVLTYLLGHLRLT
ncbi:MAG TPA: hypothetical protein VKT32_01415 [Chthonomonadaceae bacterium]|nr:hypothetical protein [Chthonomonadaceae bacterium]